MIKKINKKINNPFVYPIVILLIFSFILVYTPVFASSQSKDLTLVRKYCKRNYPTHTVKIVSKYNPKIMENRKGKKIVYVEKFISYSKGKYGYSKKGEYVKYNKKVKKGKKVVSYFIYNPYTNYCDDVVAVIDNNMLR